MLSFNHSLFLHDGTSDDDVEIEFMRWQQYWARHEPHERPGNVLDALKVSTELGTFPAVSTPLKIVATLPVTTATSERSFSALKYIKNYLRSTMSDDRLNGLALLFVHRDIPLNHDAVIDEFSKNNRRLQF